MLGVFIFYSKPPSNIEYFCKKATSKILSADDIEIVNNRHLYYIHHIDGDDIDNMKDEELLSHLVEKLGYLLESPFKKSKKGYISGDEKYYIRIIRQPKKWFRDNCGI